MCDILSIQGWGPLFRSTSWFSYRIVIDVEPYRICYKGRLTMTWTNRIVPSVPREMSVKIKAGYVGGLPSDGEKEFKI